MSMEAQGDVFFLDYMPPRTYTFEEEYIYVLPLSVMILKSTQKVEVTEFVEEIVEVGTTTYAFEYGQEALEGVGINNFDYKAV